MSSARISDSSNTCEMRQKQQKSLLDSCGCLKEPSARAKQGQCIRLHVIMYGFAGLRLTKLDRADRRAVVFAGGSGHHSARLSDAPPPRGRARRRRAKQRTRRARLKKPYSAFITSLRTSRVLTGDGVCLYSDPQQDLLLPAPCSNCSW